MLEAGFKACTDCGNLHMEGSPAPDHVDECAVCDGTLVEVEPSDLIGL